MRYKEPFSLFQRKIPCGKKIFYYSVYDELGHRKQYSTACTKKSDAKRYCYDLFKVGKLIPQKEETFAEYTQDWFVYDKCPYIQMRLLRGYSYSRSFADLKRSQLIRLVLPYFGKYKMVDITTRHVEDWLMKQKNTGASAHSLNQYLSTVRLILSEAFRKGDLKSNPASSVKAPVIKSRPRTTLTDSEVKKLFDSTALKEIWQGEKIYYLMNLTAAKTGMRIGEIQGLRWENLHPDHIYVKHSWDRNYGLKGTKNGKERIVPIQKDFYEDLISLKYERKSPGEYIFSKAEGTQPVDHKAIYKWTKWAYMAIGISEEERVKRKITFHSWRHYFNTKLLLQGIPENIVQEIIGHSDSRMTKNYTKVSLEDLKKIFKE